MGNFVGWKLNGHGSYHWADGSVHEGKFVDGVPTGQGTRRYSTGDICMGIFAQWRLNGKG